VSLDLPARLAVEAFFNILTSYKRTDGIAPVVGRGPPRLNIIEFDEFYICGCHVTLDLHHTSLLRCFSCGKGSVASIYNVKVNLGRLSRPQQKKKE
jgi:hypothetical protein